MDTLVVGAGAMGRWFGGCLADADEGTVAFADRDPAVAADAADAIDAGASAYPSWHHRR